MERFGLSGFQAVFLMERKGKCFDAFQDFSLEFFEAEIIDWWEEQEAGEEAVSTEDHVSG